MDFLPGLCTPAKFFLVFESISVIKRTVVGPLRGLPNRFNSPTARYR